MILDVVIKRYKNNAEYERRHSNLLGFLEFRQLVKWLTELKKLREHKAGKYEENQTQCPRFIVKSDGTIEQIKELPQLKMYVLNKIRAELHATAEMHYDGNYYLRDEWVDEIFDKYTTSDD